MADKVEKPKKSKAKPRKDEKGVLAALPSTRPERIGTRRASGPKTFAQPKAAQAAASPTKPKRPAAKTAPKPPATKPAVPREPEPRPRAVREAAPGMGTSGGRPDPTSSARTGEGAPAPGGRGDERSEAGSPEHGRPSGVELVTTAVQAAGELTQIGLTIGGRIIKRAVDRLPKP
jgi:hypothetical protein